jgi:nitrile hydratase beta subunit-like protein
VTFRAGDRVRVADRGHQGHHRTPGYVKGKRGRVERVLGSFTNPETRAYGSDGLPELALYQISFDQNELWPGARRHARDMTCVDIFEHWLEAE